MTVVPDLVEWLRVALDEDERVAQAAGGGVWTRECGHLGIRSFTGSSRRDTPRDTVT